MTILQKLRASPDAWIIGAAVFLFHAWHIPAMLGSAALQDNNLAFDFDVGRFVSMWTRSPLPPGAYEDYFVIRHTLVVTLRLICLPLVWMGLTPDAVGSGVAALCAGASAALTFHIARKLSVRRELAWMMTALWSLSASSLVLGLLPEAYGLAFVAIAWQFILAIEWVQGRQPSFTARAAAAVASLGITVTNVVLSGVTELFCRLAREPVRKAFWNSIKFGAAVGAIGLVLSIIAFQVWPVRNIDSSGQAARYLYWAAAKNEGVNHVSVVDPAWSFAASSFVAPKLASYPIALGGTHLYDLRGFDFTPIGWLGVLSWLMLLALGLYAAARDQQFRSLWLIAAVWIVGNIGLHSFWYYRGSIFIYASHTHLAFFILALAGARWAQDRPGGVLVYGSVVGIVTVLAAMSNLPVYWSLPNLR
jgi:hypothetical protein